MLKYVTLTGADNNTLPGDLIEISHEFPFVEWGILFFPNKSGKSRYPTLEWINAFIKEVEKNGSFINTSLHICGIEMVAEYLYGNKYLVDLSRRFQRVQLNAKFNSSDHKTIDGIRQGINAAQPQKIIIQYNPENEFLYKELSVYPNLQYLFDDSRGSGKLPEEWRAPLYGHICGYAGGLGPNNIEYELNRISQAAMSQDYWIDMESSLRFNSDTGEDCFDLSACLRVLMNAGMWRRKNEIGLLSQPYPEGDLSNLFAKLPSY